MLNAMPVVAQVPDQGVLKPVKPVVVLVLSDRKGGLFSDIL